MKLEYCDICKERANTTFIRLPVNANGNIEETFDVCPGCLKKLNKRILRAKLDFLNESKYKTKKDITVQMSITHD